MTEKFVLFSKGVALLAAAAYLLALLAKGRKSKVPPCETCKHLSLKRKDYPFDTKLWKCEHSGWKSADLQYCSQYEARETDVELAEDPAEDVW